MISASKSYYHDKWDEFTQGAFDTLKEALTSAQILSYPIDGQDYILDTDASSFALGAVLSQIQNGEEVVLGYYSKSFSKPERNYCVTRRELLALVASVKNFHHYLYGRKVKPQMYKKQAFSLIYVVLHNN